MAGDVTLEFTPAEAKLLKALLRRKYTGEGGIQVNVSPGGEAVSIVLLKALQVAPAAVAGLRFVYLSQVGGADGDDDTDTFATWTYDCYSDVARTQRVASAKSPLFHRYLAISLTPATHGLMAMVGSELALLITDEYVGRDDCA